MDPHSDTQSQSNEPETQSKATESKAMSLEDMSREEMSLQQRTSLQRDRELSEAERMPSPESQNVAGESARAGDK